MFVDIVVRQEVEEVAPGGGHVPWGGAFDRGATGVGQADHGSPSVLGALLAGHEEAGLSLVEPSRFRQPGKPYPSVC